VHTANLVGPDAPTEEATPGDFGGGHINHATKLIGTLGVCRLVECHSTCR
jgi:hypothetical protein